MSISGISDVAVQTTFRLYAFGATNSAGNAGFDRATSGVNPNVILNGSVTAVPEPSSLALLGVGTLAVVTYRRRQKTVAAVGR